MYYKTFISKRLSISILGIVWLAMAIPANAQRPSFFFAQYSMDLDFQRCVDRAQAAFQAAGFTAIRTGSSTDVRTGRQDLGSEWVTGNHATLNGWILCSKSESRTIATPMVAGPSGSAETEQMKNFLRDYMLGRPTSTPAPTPTPRPTPTQASCPDLSGTWRNSVPGLRITTTWSLKRTADACRYDAEELGGGGGAKGTASVNGRTLHLDFTYPAGAGYYDWTLNEADNQAEGQVVFSKGRSGTYTSTLTRLTTTTTITDFMGSPAGSCSDLSGDWDNALSWIRSTWTLTRVEGDRYDAREQGGCGATGNATDGGNRLRIDWVCASLGGTYEWDLNEDCSAGTGTLVYTQGRSGTHESTLTRRR